MNIKFQQGKLNKTFGRNSNGTITRIVIHETANTAAGATAQAHANLQTRGNDRDASWHYTVDANEVIQSYTHDVSCWHAGKFNKGSIAIELCVNGGFSEKAFQNLLMLVAQLKKQYPKAQVVQHYDATKKDCPKFIRQKGLWSQVVGATPAPAKPSTSRSHIAVATAKADMTLRDKPSVDGKAIKTIKKGSSYKVYNILPSGWLDLGANQYVSNVKDNYFDVELVWS